MDSSIRIGGGNGGSLQFLTESKENPELNQTDRKTTQLFSDTVTSSDSFVINPIMTSPVIVSPSSTASPSKAVRQITCEDIEGYLFKCQEIIPDPVSGGSTYVFKLREDCDIFQGDSVTRWDRFQHKIKLDSERFPAVEMVEYISLLNDLKYFRQTAMLLDSSTIAHYQIKLRNSDSSADKQSETYKANHGFLKELGYSSIIDEQGVFFYLPDLVKLNHHLAAYRLQHPHFPEVKIAYQKKIDPAKKMESYAEDRAFVEQYILEPDCVDAVIAIDKREGNDISEYVHDHTVHLLSLLIRARESELSGTKEFETVRANFRKQLMKYYERLAKTTDLFEKKVKLEQTRHSDKTESHKSPRGLMIAWFTLGMFVDYMMGFPSNNELSKVSKKSILASMLNNSYNFTSIPVEEYFETRDFGGYDPMEVRKIWDSIPKS